MNYHSVNTITTSIVLMGILSACSHEVAVTYESVPDGATVYEQGIGKLGTCPVTVKYNADDVKVADGKVYTDKIKVEWVSGATLFMGPTAITLGPNQHATYRFTRPNQFVHYQGDNSLGQDERYAVAYENSLPQPEVKYVVTSGQRRGIFDSFNTSVTCFYQGITLNPYAQCD